MLRFLTSGESHGPALVTIIDGMPAGLPLSTDCIDKELELRQRGYGRGSRQKIETDRVELLSGCRHGITSGAPLALLVHNRDFDNWRHVMNIAPVDLNDPAVKEQLAKKAIERFRPGHADLPGTLKFRHRDIRNVLERASARETAARVAAGAVCQEFLASLGITMTSHVISVGSVTTKMNIDHLNLSVLGEKAQKSEMMCADSDATKAMIDVVKAAWQDGDSLGGVVEVLCDGLPVGLGSYTQWDERLDGKLAQAVMSVQAMKAVEIGDGVQAASMLGSSVHDPILPALPSENEGSKLPFTRPTNRSGGLEGGMTNGSRLRVRAYMKPIPTLRKGLPSLSFPEMEGTTAHYERSDVCAVPAASVVVKAMVAFVLAREILAKFGGDTCQDVQAALDHYRRFCQDPGFGDNSHLGTDEKRRQKVKAKASAEAAGTKTVSPERDMELE